MLAPGVGTNYHILDTNLIFIEIVIPPAPLIERGRPFVIEASDGYCAIYAHGKSLFLRGCCSDGMRVEEVRHTHETTLGRLSPDRSMLAIGDVHGKVRVVCQEDGKWTKTVFEQSILGGRIIDMCWSPDSRALAACGEGRGTYCTAFTLEGKGLGELAGPTKACTSISWSSQNDSLAVASDDFCVYLYSGKPFKLDKTLRDHSRFVTCVKFSADGQQLASSGADGCIFLYSRDGRKRICQLKDGESGITGLDWIGDEELIDSSTSGAIRKWSLPRREITERTNFLKQQVLSIVPHENKLIAALLDGSILILSSSTLKVQDAFLVRHSFIAAINML